MLTTDGCEFDGCEDIAYAHVVIPGQPPHDAFFCGNHGPYLQRALDQKPAPAIVVTRAAAGQRARVLVQPRGAVATAVADAVPIIDRRRRPSIGRPSGR